MVKEAKLIFHKVFLVVIIILLANITLFFYKYGSNKSLTGLSIKETVAEAYTSIPPTIKVFLIAQWVVLILILAYSFIRDKRVINRADELDETDLKKISEKRGTELDALYSILQDKKKLSLLTISKVFNVNREVAMDWCKVLELGNLAYLDYPAGGPVIRLNE